MAETRSAEIDPYLRRADQVPPAALVWEEAHHQILQEALRVFELDVRPARGVGRLLQEYSIACDLADVDRDTQALGGEDAVHDRDVLVGEVAGDGEDEDTGLEG